MGEPRVSGQARAAARACEPGPGGRGAGLPSPRGREQVAWPGGRRGAVADRAGARGAPGGRTPSLALLRAPAPRRPTSVSAASPRVVASRAVGRWARLARLPRERCSPRGPLAGAHAAFHPGPGLRASEGATSFLVKKPRPRGAKAPCPGAATQLRAGRDARAHPADRAPP